MEQTILIEKLALFGMSRQEAIFYISLCENGATTGYEVSKLTGISRSNVYNGLVSLVAQGAAYTIDEGSVKKFIAVNFNEFSENKIRNLQKEKIIIAEDLPTELSNATGFVTIEGHRHIMDKLHNMLQEAENRIYLYVNSEALKILLKQLNLCIQQQKKVVIITDNPVHLPGGKVYTYHIIGNQVQLITDSNLVLMGEIYDCCVYSGQKNFVNVFKQSFANTIRLIEKNCN